MSEIVIEKNIPMPSTSNVGDFTAVLRKCEVGDSFLWTVKNRSNLHAIAKQANVKIVTRAQPDGQCRVWRIV